MKQTSSFSLDLPKICLILILLFSYSTRLWRISIPNEYYFDEVYHAFTAETYARNDPAGYEWWHQAPEGVAYEWLHPPLAKLMQGLSIYLIGDNSFAWRLPSAIFGTLTILAIYLLASTLTKNRWAGVLASLAASFDGLLLAQSRIAMNDIFVTFFILLAFVFHWRYLQARFLTKQSIINGLLAGTFAGLAMGSKWSGLFVIIVFAASELIRFALDSQTSKIKRLVGVVLAFEVIPAITIWLILHNMLELTRGENLWVLGYVALLLVLECLIASLVMGFKRFIFLAISFVLVPICLYLASFGQFWLQDRPNNLITFRDLHHQIWWYQTHLDAEHPWQSRPWEWMLNLKPVWYHVEYFDSYVANIFALANPAISWFGLLFLGGLVVYGIRKQKWQYVYLFVAYISVWTPWIASPRIMFFYHYTPGIALLTIAFGIACWELISSKKKWSRSIAVSSLIIAGGLFIYFYPHWTGLTVPKGMSDSYYWFETWKP